MTEPHTVLVIYIRAEPERIWRTITIREESGSFFYETEIEPRIGGRFRLHNDAGEPITEGTVLAFEPPTISASRGRNSPIPTRSQAKWTISWNLSAAQRA